MRLRFLVDQQNIAPSAVVLMCVSWLFQQFLGTEWWFAKLPFNWLTLVFLAFWLGQDVYRSEGRLRVFYRNVRSFGIFSPVVTRPEYFSLGDNYGGTQKFVAVIIPFVFSERKTLNAIRITSTYHRYLASKISARLGNHVWKTDEGKSFLPQERIEIPIAFIPEKAGHPGVYGDRNLDGYCFSEGTAHYVTVQLISTSWAQEHTLQIFMPYNRPSFDPTNGADSGGRFILFENMNLPKPPEDE